MKEWAGNYTITGNVENDNSSADVNLELRPRFGDGSFYISEKGIHLSIDNYAITGEVDTKIYSKKAFAAISALAIALQQKTLDEERK